MNDNVAAMFGEEESSTYKKLAPRCSLCNVGLIEFASIINREKVHAHSRLSIQY
jgi:hypothetical protein